MNKLLVIVFCVLPLIDARSLQGRPTETCIADYLKSKKLIASDQGTENPVNSMCMAIVQVTKQKIMEHIEVTLESDERMKNESSCMVDLMVQSDFADRMLVIYLLETSDDAETFEVQEKIKRAQKFANEVMLDSLITCESDEKFNEAFEELFADKSSSEEEIDDREDFCIRKHVVDNNLIVSKHLKLDINPKRLDTSEINCEILYQKALKDAENELVQALSEDSSEEDDDSLDLAKVEKCLLNVIRKENFIDQMLQFDYVKEFNLTPALKEELRSRFIKVMTKLSKRSIKCVV